MQLPVIIPKFRKSFVIVIKNGRNFFFAAATVLLLMVFEGNKKNWCE